MVVPFPSKEFDRFITESREKTLAFLRKRYTSLSQEDLEDVYQESSVALYENLKSGRYEEQNAGLYTYFLRICINQALKMVGKNVPTVPLDVQIKLGDEDAYRDDKLDELLDTIYEAEGYDEQEQTNSDNIVDGIMKSLSEKCQDLLWGHYGDGLSWEVLADMYGLANANSAKTTANRCRDKFKDLFNQKNARING